jgi:enoyl-[acyl-carrier protein] reductase / trans-2-enoyl-CoA reductase (NAD+)
MDIKPSIRSNIFMNAHPLGCKRYIEEQVNQVKTFQPFQGPKNVLIIGGSSGYGLGSRIALAFMANANTINVSFETAPRQNRTGTAGWWNNIYFQQYAKETGNIHKDFVGDAFSTEMKQNVADYIQKTIGTVDLVIYSLAAGARKDEATGNIIKSHIKTIGLPAEGKTIDIADLSIKDLTIQPATELETEETVFVMGGSDWRHWMDYLDERGVLDQGVKTISYTYIGGTITDTIYRGGTLGKAKEDLENQAAAMNQYLSQKYNGEALISSSKAVVTKASVFIPKMPIYVSCLFEVMTKYGVHETILEHKYRLYKDMVYGKKRIIDHLKRIRVDHLEMDEKIQKETEALMKSHTNESLFKLSGTQRFLKDFFQIHGFQLDGIDYEADVDMDHLALLQPE